MIQEAQVTCLCSYIISDLGLTLKRGDVVSLTKTQVDSSHNLKEAIRIRAVTIQWVTRCKERNMSENTSYVPPYLGVLQQKPGVPPLPTPSPDPPQKTISLEDLEKTVTQVVRQVVAPTLEDLNKKLENLQTTLSQNSVSSANADLLMEVRNLSLNVKELLSGSLPITPGTVKRPAPVEVETEKEPLFIPSVNLDKKSTTGSKIQADVTSSEAQGLDSALSALKEKRNGNKRRKKEK